MALAASPKCNDVEAAGRDVVLPMKSEDRHLA